MPRFAVAQTDEDLEITVELVEADDPISALKKHGCLDDVDLVDEEGDEKDLDTLIDEAADCGYHVALLGIPDRK